MKLILVRHGETIENIKGICQSHLPGTLSKLGIEQAKKLALRLKHEKIDAIYSRDLARAADTAKIIAKYHSQVPLHFVKELRERDHKHFAGKKIDEIDRDKFDSESEPWSQMQTRIKKILDKAYEKYPNSTVLFVGHGAINMALTSVILNKPPKEIDKIDIPPNTAVSIFEIREDKNHKVHLLNCVKHLE